MIDNSSLGDHYPQINRTDRMTSLFVKRWGYGSLNLPPCSLKKNLSLRTDTLYKGTSHDKKKNETFVDVFLLEPRNSTFLLKMFKFSEDSDEPDREKDEKLEDSVYKASTIDVEHTPITVFNGIVYNTFNKVAREDRKDDVDCKDKNTLLLNFQVVSPFLTMNVEE